MSLYGLLTTSASGMNAQSTLLGTVADNIANINTIGYKGSSADFASMVLDASGVSSGSVQAQARTSVSAQGTINATTSPTDLAIQGYGFFIVEDSGSQPHADTLRLLHGKCRWQSCQFRGLYADGISRGHNGRRERI